MHVVDVDFDHHIQSNPYYSATLISLPYLAAGD